MIIFFTASEFKLSDYLVFLIILEKCFSITILGDPGADSGDEEKSKWAEKYMA